MNVGRDVKLGRGLDVETSDAVLSVLAFGLTCVAAFNYVTSVYGGAIVAGIGAVLTFAFVLLH